MYFYRFHCQVNRLLSGWWKRSFRRIYSDWFIIPFYDFASNSFEFEALSLKRICAIRPHHPKMAEKSSSSYSLTQNDRNAKQQQHCCEICGKSDLTDDTMREHMAIHIDESAMCPFCGLSGVKSAELLLHVNQAHLDYLTPENELMGFIDDQSPRCNLNISPIFSINNLLIYLFLYPISL